MHGNKARGSHRNGTINSCLKFYIGSSTKSFLSFRISRLPSDSEQCSNILSSS